jgi:serine/threonine-protein kinase
MEPAVSQTLPPSGGRARVLFVDDEESILTTMRIMFRRHYDVLLASNGEQALQLLRDNDVDVLVSDQRMPGMVGVEVLREARAIRPRTMRVLLTGYSDFSAIIGSINEGEVYRFVHKPWSNAEFQSIIAQAVEAAQKTSADKVALLDTSGDAVVRPVGPDSGILVLDTDEVSVAELKKALSEHYAVYHATSLQGALDLLDKHNIGVLLVEAVIGQENVSELLSLMKQHHPQVVSIVLTHRSDANLAVDLINKGQIFRFLLKPIRTVMTTRSVNQAMHRHHTLSSNPQLAQRYRVEQTPAVAAPATVVADAQAAAAGHAASTLGLLQRIKQLRGLFGVSTTQG